ncbi:MAG: beta-ketoacyl-ACP synthase [Myxococcota bacterium]
MSRSPCSLAALGQVNALGKSNAEVAKRLFAGDTSGLTLRGDLVPERSLLFGAVRDPLPEIPARLARFACRNNRLALAALEQIGAEVDAALSRFGRARVGVVVGTSTSGVGDAEEAIAVRERTGRLAREFDYAQLEFGGLAGFVAEASGARGPAYTLSTACSSGARALASARSLVRLGICDAVISGAADSLCGLTANGFASLGALSERITNPCSRNRDGLTLGEGSALFLVTGESGGVQLLGVGESSEAHHISAPDPEGNGAEVAMRGALADAGLAPSEIAYLNLHGTGTPQNDPMECAAVARVFGTELPCSSTKALIGHALGAAGALEAAFCWLVLASPASGALLLPPHVFDGERDPAIAPIHLVGKCETVTAGAHPRVLTNSFGFGGSNCTLVLGTDADA